MMMTESRNPADSLLGRWREYRPKKTAIFFLMVASAIGTMYLGFNSGTWVSSTKADDMARVAARDARTELAGTWCVQNFLAGQGSSNRLTELQAIDSRFQRTKYIEQGTWSVMPGESQTNRRVASYCASALLELAPQNAAAGEGVDDVVESDEL